MFLATTKKYFNLFILLLWITKSAYSTLWNLAEFTNSIVPEPYAPINTHTFTDEYDFIVVGAGSAGAVVAARLSEVPCVNVLLLEAGGVPPLLTETATLVEAVWNTEVNWQFKSVPQKYACLGLQNQQSLAHAGKMLGGSSSLNGMMYVRGNKKDFDRWAAQGAEGWSYEDVLPYFLKLEDNRNPYFAATVYHNVTGPMTAETPRYKSVLKRQMRKAIEELGYDILDSNGEKQAGFHDLQGNFRNGRRCSTAKAYLVPAEKRRNLHIVTYALVKKIIIENQRAVGVEMDYKGKTYQIKATREIIVSAGALKSPQLLMLSGVGPKEELEKFNIPVLADLPVGRNFHDHILGPYPILLGPPVVPLYLKLFNPINVAKFLTEGTGPLASVSFTTFLAFLKGNSTCQRDDDPDYEVAFIEFSSAFPLMYGFNLKPEVYLRYFSPNDLKPMMACLVMNIKPRSRGTITLSSSDPYDDPLIDPNYLDDPRDYEPIVQGMKLCENLVQTKSMQALGAKPFSTVMPGCEKYVGDKDNYLRCHLRYFTSSLYHFSGSVKMGDPSDPSTVLDPKLRVKNIQGLRVADVSVMPQVTAGNTNIPAMMIGEKVADMIKETIDPNDQCENLKAMRNVVSPSVEDNVAYKIAHMVKGPIKSSIEVFQTVLEELFG